MYVAIVFVKTVLHYVIFCTTCLTISEIELCYVKYNIPNNGKHGPVLYVAIVFVKTVLHYVIFCTTCLTISEIELCYVKYNIPNNGKHGPVLYVAIVFVKAWFSLGLHKHIIKHKQKNKENVFLRDLKNKTRSIFLCLMLMLLHN